MSFSPDGKRIVSGSEDQTLKVWDAQTGEALLTLDKHRELVWSVSFSPDGKQIVSGSGDKTVMVWTANDEVSNVASTPENTATATPKPKSVKPSYESSAEPQRVIEAKPQPQADATKVPTTATDRPHSTSGTPLNAVLRWGVLGYVVLVVVMALVAKRQQS